MPFDAPVVACLAQEIQRLLPVKIDKIHQPHKDEFLFSCYGGGQSFKLLISLNSQYARFHTYQDSQPNPIQPSSFCMLLRKHLGGAKLIEAAAISFERILKLTLEVYDPLEGLSKKYLWVEFTGKTANLIVCNDKNEIIDSWRRCHNLLPGERDLSNGSRYELPPTGGRWRPVALSPDEFEALFTQVPPDVTLEKFFFKHWLGLSNPAIDEIIQRAGLNKKGFCANLSTAEITRLYRSFVDWADQISANRFQPTGIYEPNGTLIDFLAFWPSQPPDGMLAKPVNSLNQTVAASIGKRHEINRFLESKRNLLRKIKNQLEKDRKKAAKQRAEAEQAEQSEQWRIMGELLTIYGFQITKGATQTALINHYDPEGKELLIKLDPALTAQENAQYYFKKYQKAKKGQQAIAAQLSKTLESIGYLESLETMAENALSIEDLLLIQEEWEEKPESSQKEAKPFKQIKQTKGESPAKPRQFSTPTGHSILVGRNNLQNDRLTFKIAAPNDWWFHTQNIPGSHVILKLLPGREVDDETLNYACQLAVYFSKARPSTKVPVDYTQRKYVKKPPGSKPGFVIYDSFKTAIITPDPKILEELGVISVMPTKNQ